MGRPQKLTKWVLLNALGRTRNISEVARSLGVKRDTVYASAKRFGISIPTRPGRFVVSPGSFSDTPTIHNKPSLTVEDLRQVVRRELNRDLESFGFVNHGCSVLAEGCSLCAGVLRKVSAELERLEIEDGDKPKRNHLVNPYAFGIAASQSRKARTNNLAMSYAPKRKWY